MTDHKDYLDEQYRLAVLDYQTAQTERTAAELYGFEYADSLHKKYLNHLSSK